MFLVPLLSGWGAYEWDHSFWCRGTVAVHVQLLVYIQVCLSRDKHPAVRPFCATNQWIISCLPCEEWSVSYLFSCLNFLCATLSPFLSLLHFDCKTWFIVYRRISWKFQLEILTHSLNQFSVSSPSVVKLHRQIGWRWVLFFRQSDVRRPPSQTKGAFLTLIECTFRIAQKRRPVIYCNRFNWV